MRTIKLKLVDFWEEFDPFNNYFLTLLQQRFQIILCDDPDFLIYSVFGTEHLNYHCIKIFYTGENIRPDFSQCNYAFSFDHCDDYRNYRLPLYALYLDNPTCLVKQNIQPEQILKTKTKFCNFVYTNGRPEKRHEFLHKLSQYKQVDSGGRYLNNIGEVVSNKLDFIKDYKFTIAFENSAYPGYTTEKLVDPMKMFSLPIYWGNELIALDFNPKSFLNYYDFASDEALIDQIITIDQNDELYCQYLSEPYYHNNRINEHLRPENILDQFQKIFNTKL